MRERPPSQLHAIAAEDRRFLLGLTVAAVVTRLVWTGWAHPPGDYVFSDMAHYVARARHVLEHGWVPGMRTHAWQTYGTHYLLAACFWLFGSEVPYLGASLAWGAMAAATVPLTYLLATRVSGSRNVARASGLVVLAWYPALSNAGYFLAETPFASLQLAATYWLVVLLQDGRRAWPAGIASALALAVRPQIALFLGLAWLFWLVRARASSPASAGQVWRVAAPILVVVAFSLWRFHAHAGYWGGVAENANMNFTAARCHNVVTQAFPDEDARALSDAHDSTMDGRRVSLPGFRVLAQLDDDHPLSLRPALGRESIKLVGYIGDPDVHRRVRRRCYSATGVVEQIRYSVVNVSLLWFFGYQWPEISDTEAPRVLFDATVVFRAFYQWLIWLPSLIGMVWGLRELARREGNGAHGLVSLQLLVSLAVAAAFFGTIRLRLPYDPFAIVLAVMVWCEALSWLGREKRAA